MDSYRIYFLDGDNHIHSAHWFEASDDETAMWLATRLSHACSDVCAGFELWQLGRRVGRSDRVEVTETWDAADERRQEALASLEMVLRDSGSQTVASKRLLDRITDARTKRQSESDSIPQ